MDTEGSTKDGWGWWIGDNDDHYSSGPHATRDHAILAARFERIGYDSEEKTVAFCIVEAQSKPINFAAMFDAREWLEWIDENKLVDLWGENGDTRLDQLGEADISDCYLREYLVRRACCG